MRRWSIQNPDICWYERLRRTLACLCLRKRSEEIKGQTENFWDVASMSTGDLKEIGQKGGWWCRIICFPFSLRRPFSSTHPWEEATFSSSWQLVATTAANWCWWWSEDGFTVFFSPFSSTSPLDQASRRLTISSGRSCHWQKSCIAVFVGRKNKQWIGFWQREVLLCYPVSNIRPSQPFVWRKAWKQVKMMRLQTLYCKSRRSQCILLLSKL